MSGKLVFAALEADLPDHLAKLVLIVVCDHYNESQGYAWPSVETIARKCCCSERSVRNKLRLLEELGLIETIQSDGNTNRYKVSYSQGAANGAALHLVPVGAANDAPITSYEPITKKGSNQSKSSWLIGNHAKRPNHMQRNATSMQMRFGKI